MSVDVLDILVLYSECRILSPEAEEYTSFGCLKSVQLVSDYTLYDKYCSWSVQIKIFS